MNTPSQIVIAYDFSEQSELALRHAIDLATEGANREFHFLVVLESNRGIGLKANEVVDFKYTEEVQEVATQRISHTLQQVDPGGEIAVLVHVRIGDPVQQILALSSEVGASLIIVGSHGRTGVKRVVLGSVSEKVVREAKCPVFVARDRSYGDVRRSKIINVAPSDDNPEYVPPHRYHYNSGVPTRSKAWALY